jgi:hypothetical protein
MYNEHMHILRRGGSAVLLALFQLFLFIFPVALALTFLLQSPDFIRQTVKDSGVYDTLVPMLLDESAEQVSKEGDQQAADLLKEQGVRDAVANSFNNGQIESASNQAIDGFYAWLQGKTPTPEFTIDLTSSRQAFLDNMNQYALQRASSLPVCNVQQLRQLQGESGINILDAPCLPPGVSPETAASQFSQQAVANSEFLAKPVINSNDLKNANGEPVFAAAEWLPQAYQWLMRSAWILGALIILTGAGTILLHEERRRGIRRIAIAFLIAGIIILLGSAAYWLFFANVDRLLGGVTSEFQSTISRMMASSLGSYVQTVALTGGAYAVLGAIGLIVTMRQERAAKQLAPMASPNSAIAGTPTPAANKPQEQKSPEVKSDEAQK